MKIKKSTTVLLDSKYQYRFHKDNITAVNNSQLFDKTE